MTYRIVYTARAARDIRKLDAAAKARVGAALGRFEEEPLSHARPLIHSDLGQYRFRIGSYRVIFDLVGPEIVVLRVGHRSDIYRG